MPYFIIEDEIMKLLYYSALRMHYFQQHNWTLRILSDHILSH